MSLAALQGLFEDMFFSADTVRQVFSSEGAAYATTRGLTPREYALLVSVEPEAYAAARSVGPHDLQALFPATSMALRLRGIDVELLCGRFFDSPHGRDFNAPSRPDALAAYLREEPCCARVWEPQIEVLLQWECALVRRTAPLGVASRRVRLAPGVQVLEFPWDMPAWTEAMLAAQAWLPAFGERKWYALQATEMPGLGGRAVVWDIGPVFAMFLDDIHRAVAPSCGEDTLERHLLEHGRALGLIAPAEDEVFVFRAPAAGASGAAAH